jgi:hypothetical protein
LLTGVDWGFFLACGEVYGRGLVLVVRPWGQDVVGYRSSEPARTPAVQRQKKKPFPRSGKGFFSSENTSDRSVVDAE